MAAFRTYRILVSHLLIQALGLELMWHSGTSFNSIREPKGGEIVRVAPRPSILENLSLEEMKQVFAELPEALRLLALARTADGTRARYSRLYRTLAMKGSMVPLLQRLETLKIHFSYNAARENIQSYSIKRWDQSNLMSSKESNSCLMLQIFNMLLMVLLDQSIPEEDGRIQNVSHSRKPSTDTSFGSGTDEPKGGEIVRVAPRPSILENLSLEEMKQVFAELPEALRLLALARTADGTRARYSRLYRTLAMKVPSLRDLVSEFEKGGALKDLRM
ncbi:hypothetical protein DEO72_LG2g1514 [Vigna unguiculata]|uniref:Uncharacterized protein n=1 Tax=Vigna unguiculata TaxID=3917 RepID=A0A4D6KZ87_VIGUN|nr:hypothetical protein DEO72_LG2g1514 [Vigna unguiculata]